MHLECKRLKSAKRVGRNLQKALSQLASRMSVAPTGSVGIAALDFTDLLPPGQPYVETSFKGCALRHMRTLREVLDNHRNDIALENAPPWSLASMCVGETGVKSRLPRSSIETNLRPLRYLFPLDQFRSQKRVECFRCTAHNLRAQPCQFFGYIRRL